MSRSVKTLRELRAEQYAHHDRLYPFMNQWKTSPYTFVKARFYMEASAVLVYLLLKTNIRPNTVTIVYGLAGVIGGVLLAIPNQGTITAAVAIFFLKGILDWSDGYLARVTGQTSLTGHVLDCYGALLNSLGFIMGLGFYVAAHTQQNIYYYLLPLIPFFSAANMFSFGKMMAFEEISSLSDNHELLRKERPDPAVNKPLSSIDPENPRYRKIFAFFKGFLDDRARSVDFICLVILVEIYAGTEFMVSPILFLLILAKKGLVFLGYFYLVSKGGWCENQLEEKVTRLKEFLQQAAGKIE